nr:MAG TPA: tail assembly protein [Caudoviricetes sp.]
MIRFFCKYKNRIIQLPVNPENIEINNDSSNEEIETVSIGKVNNIGLEGLRSLSIKSFFPKKYNGELYINTSGQFEDSDFYIEFFENIKKEREPFRLIITELNINFLVAIESFNITYAYGTDDVDYELNLKEFKNTIIKTLNSNLNNNSFNLNSNRLVERNIPKTYIVKKGDSLWLIARMFLGDGNRWREIYLYNNNRNIIGGNPNLIFPGQVLSIPA